MRRAKNGAVYRACAVPEKNKKPKKQVRGNPIPEDKRKLPVKKAYPSRPPAKTQAPNGKVKLNIVPKAKKEEPKKKKLKIVPKAEKKKEEPKAKKVKLVVKKKEEPKKPKLKIVPKKKEASPPKAKKVKLVVKDPKKEGKKLPPFLGAVGSSLATKADKWWDTAQNKPKFKKMEVGLIDDAFRKMGVKEPEKGRFDYTMAEYREASRRADVILRKYYHDNIEKK